MVATRRLRALVGDLRSVLELPDGDLVVALSGGADSAGLAFLVADTGRSARAIHVDHGTPGAPLLAKAATAIAAQLEMNLHIEAISLPDGGFSEGRARAGRYRVFGEQRRGDEWVLTAHTLEDQAETVLMNLIRGTGPLGLAGIPRRSKGWVARPILDASRGDIRELVTLAGLSFFDDPSNIDVEMRRNAIRRELLPDLARFNPSIVDSLARAASLIREHLTIIDDAVESIPAEVTGESAKIPIGHLMTAPRAVAAGAIRRAVGLLQPPYPPTAAEFQRIWEVVTGENRATEIAAGIRVERRGPMLFLGSDPEDSRVDGPVPLTPGTHHVGSLVLEVTAQDGPSRVTPIGVWTAVFSPDASLTAEVHSETGVVVHADGVLAWAPGEKRHPVAFYQSGTSGYLSVSAREDSE